MDIAQKFRDGFLKHKTPRLRDRRGHHASTIMSDMRDQYWSIKGEPETNPPDLTGHIKMWLGSTIEDGVSRFVRERLHYFGLHLRGTQISAGGSNPSFDCYLDGIVDERIGDKWGKTYVLEIKTKSGYGADLLLRSMEPSIEYMIQLGLYLQDTHKKGITNEGIFVYIPLSDNTIGDILFVYCRYDEATNTIEAYRGDTLLGDSRDISFKYDIGVAARRANLLEKHVADGVTPKCEYPYKAKLTPEFLEQCSDAHISKAIKGEKILGNWQGAYSKFLNKRLEVDGEVRQYTEEEISLLRKEYLKRHPRSKI